MFEKINTHEYKSLSNPSYEFVNIIKLLKKKQQAVTVAEVGIGIGTTTLKAIEQLDHNDTLYLFDFQRVLEEFAVDIKKHHFGKKGINIVLYGNSSKRFDSFNWNFAKIILQRQGCGKPVEFLDAVYLDGAHTFMHTVAACCLLKKMLKPGGFLIFDDLPWTLEGHLKIKPERRAAIEEDFTTEQINTPHIAMVVDIFMKTDPEYHQVQIGSGKDNWRAIFQKKSLYELVPLEKNT